MMAMSSTIILPACSFTVPILYNSGVGQNICDKIGHIRYGMSMGMRMLYEPN